MPATVYQYYRVVNFPLWQIGNEFRTNHQEALLQDIDNDPQTVVTYLGNADYSEFAKYHVFHETYQKIRGRYKNEPIHSYIEQLEFYIFLNRERNFLLINAPRRFCKEMINRIERSSQDFDVNQRQIDLVHLGQDLRNRIRGGWFGDLHVADVSSIGLFGPTVGESYEWNQYGSLGVLRSIDVEFIVAEQNLLVKILGNSGVVHFENLTEYQSIERVSKIQRELDFYECA